MAFTETQRRKLKARLNPKHVKTRTNNGMGWSYIEGWHAIAEANRIFGHDGWDRRTVEARCVAGGPDGDRHHAAYTAKVEVTVRAGATIVVREGCGTGEGKAATPGQAHELALKGAETDATKRALATFGNPFGLSLYSADASRAPARQQPGLRLRSAAGEAGPELASPEEFAAALRGALQAAPDIEHLFNLWENNVATVRALSRWLRGEAKGDLAPDLVTHFKAMAIGLASGNAARSGDLRSAPEAGGGNGEPGTDKRSAPHANGNARSEPVDKSALALSEPKRIRSKSHLRFVASQPCLVCGRSPSQAHHVRYAQPRAMARKVSDEYAVPLCAIHHTECHHTGDEQRWWEEKRIDPLTVARRLWAE